MILVLLGGFVFAQEEAAADSEGAYEISGPSFSGNAKLSWGIDFGNGEDADKSHGFKNEASASVSLPLVSGSKSNGEGDVYAYINLSGISLGLEANMKESKTTGKVGDVEAKIVFYGAYITIYNAPTMKNSYAHRIMDGDAFEPGFDGAGTKIGYANKDIMDLDVGLKFVSNGSWEDRGADAGKGYIKAKFAGKKVAVGEDSNTKEYFTKVGDVYQPVPKQALQVGDDSPKDFYVWGDIAAKDAQNGKYGFGIDFHMTPVEKFLTVDANFNMTFVPGEDYVDVNGVANDENTVGFGVKLSSNPIDALTLDLGFDGGKVFKKGTETGMGWALGFGAKYDAGQFGTIDTALFVANEYTAYGNKNKDGVDMAMTLGYAGLSMVEGLDVHARFTAWNILSERTDEAKEDGFTLPMAINFGAAYKASISDAMWVKPYADLWASSNNKYLKDDKNYHFALAYALGVEFSPMERLTIDANWTHGTTEANTVTYKSVKTPCAGPDARDNGLFVLSAKITY